MNLKIYHTSKYNIPIPFPAFNAAHAQKTDSFFRGEWVKTKTIQKCCDRIELMAMRGLLCSRLQANMWFRQYCVVRYCQKNTVTHYSIQKLKHDLYYINYKYTKKIINLSQFSPPHQPNGLFMKGYTPTSFPLSFLWVVAFLWFCFPFLERSPSYENKKKTILKCISPLFAISLINLFISYK